MTHLFPPGPFVDVAWCLLDAIDLAEELTRRQAAIGADSSLDSSYQRGWHRTRPAAPHEPVQILRSVCGRFPVQRCYTGIRPRSVDADDRRMGAA